MSKVKLKVWHPAVGDFEVEVEENSPVYEFLSLNNAAKISFNNLAKGVHMIGLDHYVGRPFVSVFQGDDAYDWAIQLEGGVLIRNKDGRRTAAPKEEELAGSSFLLTTFSELDTILHFGTSNVSGSTTTLEITLTPTQYTLSDPEQYGETEIYPQVPDNEESLIPDDPSPDRVAEGPDDPQVTHMHEAPESASEATADDNA